MWQETNSGLYKKFEFKDFDEAFNFMELVAGVAKQLNHHPKMVNTYNIVELTLSTHSEGGKITVKDKDFAEKVDQFTADFLNGPSIKLAEAKLFSDGGSRGNPGPSAIGYVIMDMDDNIVKKEGIYLGITTNNQAEYRGLIAGMENALLLGVRELHVFMDSLLVVNQVNGIWKMKNAELMPLHTAIRGLISKFERVTIAHVPRSLNKIADAMVNECMDNQ